MLRRLTWILAALAVTVCAARADDVLVDTFAFANGTNVSGYTETETLGSVKGPIYAIDIDCVGTNVDVDIDITAGGQVSTMTALTLYSADDVTTDTRIRPVYDSHTAAGDITNGYRDVYIAAGETITITLSDWASVTNQAVNISVKYGNW